MRLSEFNPPKLIRCTVCKIDPELREQIDANSKLPIGERKPVSRVRKWLQGEGVEGITEDHILNHLRRHV